MKRPIFWGLHATPSPWSRWFLAGLPFLILIFVYLIASDLRLEENPSDKLLPSFEQMGQAIYRYSFVEDKRTGDLLLWTDTFSSLKRLLLGVFLAAITGLLLGLNMGLFPGFSYSLNPFMTMISMVPPLSILPILFIAFGVGETGKVILIYIGTFPLITRDIYMATKKFPKEKLVKALTLGASQLAVVYKIVMPIIFPRLIASVRLVLGAAWLFLIASEAISSNEGLGYRIFLVRRYLSMDIIIPYVIWITLLGFTLDYVLSMVNRYCFPWYSEKT